MQRTYIELLMNGLMGKNKMGTILSISSHLPSTTKAVSDFRLLLLWPAASSDTRPVSATHGFQVLPVTAEPSGFPFPCRGMVPGWSVFQALCISRRMLHQFQLTRSRSSSYSEAMWLNRWKNASGFRWLTEHRGRGVLLVQASALLVCRPEGLTEADPVSFK